MMVDLGALFVQNIYKPYLRPAAPDSHYLIVGRCASVVLIICAMGMIEILPNVLDALLQSDSLAAFMGVAFIAGLVWRRANRVGAIAAFVVGTGTNMSLSLYFHGNITEWHMDLFLYSLAASIAAMVVGSLLSPAESPDRWAFVHERLHTPVSVDDAPEAERKVRAAHAEAHGEGLLLADLGQLHRTFSFRRYRIDLLGAAAALLLVGALILIALAIAHA